MYENRNFNSPPDGKFHLLTDVSAPRTGRWNFGKKAYFVDTPFLLLHCCGEKQTIFFQHTMNQVSHKSTKGKFYCKCKFHLGCIFSKGNRNIVYFRWFNVVSVFLMKRFKKFVLFWKRIIINLPEKNAQFSKRFKSIFKKNINQPIIINVIKR